MRKIDVKQNGKERDVYAKGTPNFNALEKIDYENFISFLEIEIRNFYKDENDETRQIKGG